VGDREIKTPGKNRGIEARMRARSNKINEGRYKEEGNI
jgi:hypothetical protein